MFIYVLVLVATLVLMFMLKNCDNGHRTGNTPVQQHTGTDTIHVAIEYSPLSLYTYNDTLGGFNYDMLRLIARKNNVRLKFYPVVTLSKSLAELKEGRYDIVVSDIPKTTEYQDSFLFTEPIYLDRQVLVQLKDSISGKCRINTPLELAGDTVWVVAGSPFAGRIANLAREIGDTIYTVEEPIYASEQLFLMVATGEIKQAVINERVAELLAREYPSVDISTSISFTQFQPWVVNSRDKELCDSLNKWIDSIKGTPVYKSLEKRYFR